MADAEKEEGRCEGEAVEPEVLPPAGGVSERALREVARLLPGLGGLLDALSRSPAFQVRLAEADARIAARLREAGSAGAEQGGIRVVYGYRVRGLDAAGPQNGGREML